MLIWLGGRKVNVPLRFVRPDQIPPTTKKRPKQKTRRTNKHDLKAFVVQMSTYSRSKINRDKCTYPSISHKQGDRIAHMSVLSDCNKPNEILRVIISLGISKELIKCDRISSPLINYSEHRYYYVDTLWVHEYIEIQ